ncbi:MazG family protein [Candidatus Protochlamydia naegleriophila]|uniref:MazG family protein n=1 Tax=Candidatus Protochlamydia naegleriophila TaxID=389348 RepID=A0A0U5JC94_9BACT|nr:MazG family protein [Candidatus Protochlamydia naegleriophila]CUI17086.1 MazG family protein [Candidatus Protochlamydia naegleriophila]
MDDFKKLVTIIERLLAPDGCPWDREQTLHSMRSSLIEETYEVVEAIDLDDAEKMKEELGDLCFNVAFLSKLAEKEGRFSLQDVLQEIAEKLIRRHPHIFAEAKIGTADEVLKQWEAIKRKEKGENSVKSALDGIPKDLPSLARAQKVIKRFQKAGFEWQEASIPSQSEDVFAQDLLDLIKRGVQNGLDAETALRKTLSQIEQQFRVWESTQE